MAKTVADVPLTLPVIAPTEDEWRAMTPSAREDLLVRILDALSDPAAAMSEGGLHKIVTELKARADKARAQIQEATEQATRAQAQAQEAQAQAQQAQAQTQQAEAQIEEAHTALREGIAALLGARGIACSDEARERLSSCSDAATLQRWLFKAMTAGTEEEVFSG